MVVEVVLFLLGIAALGLVLGLLGRGGDYSEEEYAGGGDGADFGDGDGGDGGGGACL